MKVVLCIRGSLAAYLLFTHWTPPHPFPSCDHPGVSAYCQLSPGRLESPPEENHYSKHMFQPLSDSSPPTSSLVHCTALTTVSFLWTELLLVPQIFRVSVLFPPLPLFPSSVYPCLHGSFSNLCAMRICISNLQECRQSDK